MKRRTILRLALLASATPLAASLPALAQDTKPIRIGVPTSIQLQVGRDTIDAMQMAIDEINGKGGVLGRKMEMVVADETENPEQGINAIKKLTADEKVDVLIGGYTSGVTLAQLPHIASAKTIYMGVGAASPAITNSVKQNYERNKYIFRVQPLNSAHQARQVVEFISGKLMGEQGMKKIGIVGENAKWVQDLVPVLKKGAVEAGAEVPLTEFFDTASSDFSPLLSKIRSSGIQYCIIILSHASSDIFVKQWHDAQVPVPIGGIDVKSQDPDFYDRVGGKAISEITSLAAIPAKLSPRTIPFFDAFKKRYNRNPVYTAFGAFDSPFIYAEAVQRAGSTDPEKVIKEMEKTDYQGIPGRIVFDEMHDVKPGPGLTNLLFVQWQDGGKRVVVWPKEVSDGAMINPPWMKK